MATDDNWTRIGETRTIKMLNLKKDLYATGDGFAIEMIEAMQKWANASTSYADMLDNWLKRGGTVELWSLCLPFRGRPFLKALRPKHPQPWVNCVDAIDNAWLRVSQSEKNT